MINDYLRVGDSEVINTARLYAYANSVGVPLSLNACGCDTLRASVLGDEEYTTPDDPDNPAPWWDPDIPESGDFVGFLPLSIDGVEDYPMRRAVSAAVTGGGVFGPARVQPMTLTVTGLILAVTCCGAAYGLHWLGEALGGCTGSGCGGDCLTAYNCCPGTFDDPDEFNAHRRTFRRVALVEGPRVLERRGEGCSGAGECSAANADIPTVEFVLTAATPWPWTDPEVVIDRVPLPRDGSGGCFTWCVHASDPPPAPACVETGDGACRPGAVPVEFGDQACGVGWEDGDGPPPDPCQGACRLAACPDPAEWCSDPECSPVRPPVPTAPESCFCEALAVEADVYELDLSPRAGWSADAVMITIEAGSEDLRRLKVTFYERTSEHEGMTCEEVADAERCNPHSTYHVGYVPAGATLTLDGQIERAMVECAGVCETARDVWGSGGGPPSWRLLDCDTYCMVVESDAGVPPAGDATLTVAVSGRGY